LTVPALVTSPASVTENFAGDFEIDRASPIPAYYQVQEWLTQRIESGELAGGFRLPSERELTERLGVSRMTLRQALDRLERECLLIRRQGAGTFVASPRLVGEIGQLRGITAELAEQGQSSRTRVLGLDRAVPPRRVREALGLGPRATAIRVRRVRFVDGHPLSLETSWLHPERCEAILSEDLTDRSLYEVLVQRCGLRLARGYERITATVLDAFESEQLDAKAGQPAFRVQRTTWDASGAPMEFVVTVLRADRFSFEAVLGDGAVERTPTLEQTGA
jgi:GntR family transcriptional regulator